MLVNILGNAVKFTEPGGSVEFTLETVGRTTHAERIRFSVRDTGIGISEEAQSRIFNAFEQAERAARTAGSRWRAVWTAT